MCLNLKFVFVESAKYWRNMQYAVVCMQSHSRVLFCCRNKYYTTTAMTGLRYVAWLTFVDWMYGIGVVLLVPLTSRPYVCLYCCLCAWIKSVCLLKVLHIGFRCSMRSYVCNLTLMCYLAVQINDTLQWRWLTGLRVRYVAWLAFVGWMYGTRVVVLVPLTSSAYVCLYCCLYAWIWSVSLLKLLHIGVWCSMRSYVISLSSAILLSK